MIGIVVRFDLTDDAAAARFDDLTATVVGQIAEHEPGTLLYATQRVAGEPLARVFVELYRDEPALQAHEDAAHVRRFHELKQPLLGGPPRVEHVVPGPSAGLDRVAGAP